MKSLKNLLLTSLLAIFICSMLLTACQKNSTDIAPGFNSISLYLTDDPSLVFDNIFLDIQKVEIKAEDENEHHNNGNDDIAADDNGSTSGGWVTLISKPGIYDILKFRNGLDTLFSTGYFMTGRTLKKVRITLGNSNKVVFNGTSFPLSLKKNFVVINLEEAMLQQSTGTVHLWLDFDAGRSIRKSGNNFQLEPQLKAFSKEKAGAIEGRVSPADAKAIVMAIIGADTSTAKPEHEGEFKIIGLKAGTYKLLVRATANNYLDATLANVIVKTKEDTQVGSIVLHK